MSKAFERLGMLVLLMVLASAIGLITAFPVKWTWNATMPEIFDLIEITWGQAWCLNFLAGMLIQSSYSHNSDQ